MDCHVIEFALICNGDRGDRTWWLCPRKHKGKVFWAVVRTGRRRASSVHESLEEAAEAARSLANATGGFVCSPLTADEQYRPCPSLENHLMGLVEQGASLHGSVFVDFMRSGLAAVLPHGSSCTCDPNGVRCVERVD